MTREAGPTPLTDVDRRRPPLAGHGVLLAGLAAAALAAAAVPPAVWAATRPPSAVGAPVGAPSSRAAPPWGQAAPPASPPAAPPTGTPSLPQLRPAAPAQAVVAEAPAPVVLRVPALGIDAPVDPVGVMPDGFVEVPADAARTGWYRAGARPADGSGSTVLVGHVDSPAGPGVLFDLSRAEPGQDVVVVDADGTEHAYRVTGRAQLPKDQLASADLFTTAGPPRLVLISCGGDFDRATHHYRDNVVVVAEPLGP